MPQTATQSRTTPPAARQGLGFIPTRTKAGNGLTQAGPAGDLVLSADVQAILDGLGTTRGDVLYRGAADWTVLAPGTAGFVLTTGGPAADPTWTAATSGDITAVFAGAGLTGGGTSGDVTLALDLTHANAWTGAASFGAAGNQLAVTGAAGTNRVLQLQTAGVNRWILYADSTAEGGANSGSNAVFYACTDAGALNVVAWTAQRDTGVVTFPQLVGASISGNAATATKWVTSRTLSFTTGATGSGSVDGSGNVAIVLTLQPFYAITTFTSNGTFTTPAGSSAATVYRYRIIGAGGGGGGANGTGATAGGGGSGAYAEGTFTGVAAATGITVTVGATGAAGANTGGTGGTGGSSSIGSPVSITCTGGVGGVGSTSATISAPAGGAGGTVSVGSPSVSVRGANGSPGNGASTTTLLGGQGAASPLGGGGMGACAGFGNGTAGVAPGSGGGGAAGATAAGSVGAIGVVIIERMTQ